MKVENNHLENQLLPVITTSLKKHPDDVQLAREIGMRHGLEYIVRGSLSVREFAQAQKADYFLAVRQGRLSAIKRDGHDFFFHPGTGLIRTKNLDKGLEDILIRALGITPADHVLDCTAGLANDAIVIAHYLTDGRVSALEKNRIIYLITSYGLQLYRDGSGSLRESFRRIKMHHSDYQTFLEQATVSGDQQYDSIYFDPMFIEPVSASAGIHHLRHYAEYDQLSEEIIRLARSICNKRVVVKIRNTDSSFVIRMKPDEIIGSSKASIKYAIFTSLKERP